MTAEIEVFLTLRGAGLTPELARERVGREPDRARMPPGHGKLSRPYVKEPWCAYASGLAKDRQLDEHIRALLDSLKPFEERIGRLRDELGLTVMIDAVVECYEGYTPPLYFEPALLQRMTDWKAAFWIDLYTFEEKASGATDSGDTAGHARPESGERQPEP